MENNFEETKQTMQHSPDEETSRNENSAINDRLEILQALFELVESANGESIDEITYLRLKAGIDYLIYELNHLLNFRLKRGLVIDDISARDIANMTKVEQTDKRDIAVKTGIDQEMEYICNFIDHIIENKNNDLKAEDLVQFIQKQFEVNEIIEKFFRKG